MIWRRAFSIMTGLAKGSVVEPRGAGLAGSAAGPGRSLRSRLRVRFRDRRRAGLARRGAGLRRQPRAPPGPRPARLVEVVAQAHGLADPVAQVVELGTAHLAPVADDDVLHARRVQREDALDALAGHQAAHHGRAADTRAADRDGGAGEHLHALLVALADQVVHF